MSPNSHNFAALVMVAASWGVIAQQPATPPPSPSLKAQTALPPSSVPALTVRFEGGDVPANASRVLDLLRRNGLLGTKTADVRKGQSVCDVYRDTTGFPMGCTADLRKLANALNRRDYGQRSLQIGDPIAYPDVHFTPTIFSKRFDPRLPQDQKELQDVRQNWSQYIVSDEKLPTGLLKVNLQGFELKVPMESAEAAGRATRALESARIPHTRFTHPEAQKRLQMSQSVISPTRYVQSCLANMLQPGDQCAYSLLVGLPALDWVQCREQGRCADVYLVDRPVHPHPSLKDTVADGFVTDLKSGGLTPSMCRLPALEDEDHGTHLAGIIGASGPACVGLNPAARIHSWNRELDAAITTDDIERVQSHYESNVASTALPIFVYASSWTFENKKGQRGDKLTKEEDRLTNPIASQINSQGALWIVAAGQPQASGERPVQITADLALGPMNLGDLRNVVVVTACVDCSSAQPKLLAGVNFSDTMVHLAAPGDDVPGPAGAARLAVGGGTSQATAFVAGVASAMVAKYPNSFVRPEAVKSRLQYTSRPLLTGVDASHLATGVVDPAVALLPPDKDYWQPLAGSLTEAAIDHWCMSSLHLVDPGTLRPLKKDTIRTKDILRMYRVNRDDENATPRWIFYTKVPWDSRPGEVMRIGPGVIAGGRPGQPFPVFRPKGGTAVSAATFEDLLVHNPVGIGSMSCGS